MDAQPVFGTPLIAVAAGDTAGRNAELAAAVMARTAAPSAGEVPGSGWRSGRLGHGWGGAAAAALARDAVALAREHSVDTGGGRGDRFAWRCDMEAVLLPPGARTLPAFAPLAFWSAIYCVENGREGAADPEGGAIELEDPRAPLILMEAPSLRFTPGRDGPADEPVHRLRPAAGELFMFPGWLRRAHTPDHGPGRRIFLHLDLIASQHD